MASTVNSLDFDVVVVGGGAVGLTTALDLARSGIRVGLVGFSPDPRDDGRTAALMQPSLAILDAMDALDPLRLQSAPLAAIRMIDMTGALLRAPTVTFRAREIELDYFALNFSNADIVRTLAEQLTTQPDASLFTALLTQCEISDDVATLTLDDGTVLASRLVIAADGQKSMLREHAGIVTRSWSYPQTALTFHVRHTKDHEDISTEFHTRSGPLTFVPFGDYKSSVVWLETPAEAARLQTLSPQQLAQAVQRRSQSLLGDLTLVSAVGAVPMRAMMARTAVAKRLALVGEALHAFPPVGAQGMNLGLRDAEEIARLVRNALNSGDDPGSDDVLQNYQRGRSIDATTRTIGVDLLNRSMISGLLPFDLARTAGLSLLSHIAPLRRVMMRAGMGESPKALRLAGVK